MNGDILPTARDTMHMSEGRSKMKSSPLEKEAIIKDMVSIFHSTIEARLIVGGYRDSISLDLVIKSDTIMPQFLYELRDLGVDPMMLDKRSKGENTRVVFESILGRF